ncbi:hypothetical protein AgCh_034235 [Apium graveolens]
MIPEKFVRKYGKHLNVRVYLKAPGRAVWDVDLVRDGNNVWLQNGWPEFARFYSLCFGHFLIFKYRESSQFDVFIYDKRGTEIDYLLVRAVPHMNHQGNLNLREFTQVRKRAMIDINELKACKKARANFACREPCHIGECLMRKLQHPKITDVKSGKVLIEILDDNIQLPKPKNGGIHLDGSTGDAGKAKALGLAKDLKSKNPSFILTVSPSYIGPRSQVGIQSDFARRYMRSKQKFQVCLQVE